MLSVASYTDAWIEIRKSAALPAWQSESHPTRMRGLKLGQGRPCGERRYVASYTDAWIEIMTWCRRARRGRVASYTDAWIEMKRYRVTPSATLHVASYTDAWIEMLSMPLMVHAYTASHPTRMRGLKF